MPIGVLGLGNLGGSIVKGLIKSGYPPDQIFVYDQDERKHKEFTSMGVHPSVSSGALLFLTEVIFMCVKPSDFEKAARNFSFVEDSKALVSFVGGVKLESLATKIHGKNVFRAMPNISSEVCESVIALASPKTADANVKKKVVELLSKIGDVYEVEDSQIDAFTSLSGSGVAFAAEMIKAFYEAGVLLGLSHDNAKKVAVKVFLGTSKLLSQYDFEEISKRVATPGGTTIEGLYVLEKTGVRGSIIEAIKAGAEKASKLSC
ncbi:MAG: pyrroline-5-carboxylate reductase [Nitrososphaeria archaeon]